MKGEFIMMEKFRRNKQVIDGEVMEIEGEEMETKKRFNLKPVGKIAKGLAVLAAGAVAGYAIGKGKNGNGDDDFDCDTYESSESSDED